MRTVGAAVLLAQVLQAQSAANVLVVVNNHSELSRQITDYYVRRRGIPQANVCHLKTAATEEIQRTVFEKEIEAPLAGCLKAKRLTEQILYIVTTMGVPLRIPGTGSSDKDTTAAAVDSELALLYQKMRGTRFPTAGPVRNPFFNQTRAAFSHPQFPIYLVTRLAGYDFQDVKALIDRALTAQNRGRFVLDLRSSDNDPGNQWLRAAARQLPKDRLLLDETSAPVYGATDVIGYAAWGSNDGNRKRRMVGFQWLPGAIATEYVSTNGRTFQRPPGDWNITTWKDTAHFFAGSPQSLTADYIHEGATGCSGHVYEPFLTFTPRHDILLPAYYWGRNLAEAYYLAIPALSWQTIVVGDPLCRIGRPVK